MNSKAQPPIATLRQPIAGAEQPKAAAIDGDTVLEFGGQAAVCALACAAGEIEAAADALVAKAADIQYAGDGGLASTVRTLALRVKSMNSLTLSYAGPDSITLADAFKAIYGRGEGTHQLEEALERLPKASAEAGRGTTESEFMSGVALGRQLFKVAMKIGGDLSLYDAVNLNSKYREGTAQNNFALAPIEELLANPNLAEGFAAVLSDLLGSCEGVASYKNINAFDMSFEQMKGITPTGKRPKSPRRAASNNSEAALA